MFLFHLDENDIQGLQFLKYFNNYIEDEKKVYCVAKEGFLKHMNEWTDSNKCIIIIYKDITEIYQVVERVRCKFVFYSDCFINFWKDNLSFVKFKLTSIYNKSENDYTICFMNNNNKIIKKENKQYILDLNHFNIENFYSLFREIIKYTRTFGVVKDNNCLLFKGNYDVQNPVFQMLPSTQSLPSQSLSYKEFENKKICYHTYKDNSSTLIKDNIYEKNIKICLIGDWIESTKLVELWKRYCIVNNTWENLEIVDENSENIDYYVVINRPKLTSNKLIPSNKIILFHMEPNMNFVPWYKEYLNEFSSEDLLFNGKHLYHHNNVDWHLNKTYFELLQLKPEKTKGNRLSMILSSRKDDTGHKMRLLLAHHIDKDDELELDIYGKCEQEKFRNFKYELPYYTRDEGLIPYKYHFMAENNCIKNYFTEKIIDCILSETLCFYYGCPNLNTFINPKCYIELPLYNIGLSKKIIKESILNGEWEKRIDFIRQEKIKLLNHYSLLPRVKSILKLNNNTNILIYTNQVSEISSFIQSLKDQSFKNIKTMYNDNELITKDKLLEICNLTLKEGHDSFILNHSNYKDKPINNLIYDRICTSFTVLRQLNKTNELILFTRGDLTHLKMDMYIPLEIANKIIQINRNNNFTVEELLNSVKINVLKYVF